MESDTTIREIKKLAKDRAELNGGTTNCHFKQLIHTEQQRKTNRRIKLVLKPLHKKGVTHVMIPARHEYGNQDPNFDHHNVDEMWKRIYPQNGKDIKDWGSITNANEMERIMLLLFSFIQ